MGIGDSSMSAFASTIASAISSGSLGALRELHLNWNSIGDAGISALAGAIASGSLGKLTSLDLEFNQISDVGIASLSEAIASGSLASLRKLVVPSPHEKNPELKAASAKRDIELV